MTAAVVKTELKLISEKVQDQKWIFDGMRLENENQELKPIYCKNKFRISPLKIKLKRT